MLETQSAMIAPHVPERANLQRHLRAAISIPHKALDSNPTKGVRAIAALRAKPNDRAPGAVVRHTSRQCGNVPKREHITKAADLVRPKSASL